MSPPFTRDESELPVALEPTKRPGVGIPLWDLVVAGSVLCMHLLPVHLNNVDIGT